MKRWAIIQNGVVTNIAVVVEAAPKDIVKLLFDYADDVVECIDFVDIGYIVADDGSLVPPLSQPEE